VETDAAGGVVVAQLLTLPELLSLYLCRVMQ
jgi:hypothetical protein